MEQNVRENQSLAIIDQARDIKVIDIPSRTSAAAFIITAKGALKEIKASHEDLKDAAYQTWKIACQEEKAETGPIIEAIKLLEEEINAFDLAEMNKKQAEEAAFKAEADKKRAEIEKQIQKAHAKNDLDKVDELTDKVAAIMNPVMPTQDKTVKFGGSGGGFSTSPDIEVEVVDLAAFVVAVAAGKIPITVIDIKLTTLKSWIKSSGLTQAPGVLIKPKNKYTTRTGGGV